MKTGARIVTVCAAAATAAAATCLVGTSPAPAQQAKKGKETVKLISGALEPIAPPDQLIIAIKKLTDKAKTDMDDGEMDLVSMRFAVAAELSKLLTLRDNAELKAWGDKAGKAYIKGAKEGLDREDAAAIFKESTKLLAEAEKASKRWAGAKAVPGTYTPANQNLKHLMTYTAETKGGLGRAVGLPGMRAKEYQEATWALAEVGNICIIFSEKKDWRDWSAKHRDYAAGLAKQLSKGEFTEARKTYSALESNCKTCHDKYSDKAPTGK